jgi:thiamine-monophosphate kinase
MDVSDGLLLDAARMAEASQCALTVELSAVPVSEAFIAAQGGDSEALLFAATGGDDYALLFALAPETDPFTLSLPSGTRMSRIGTFGEGSGLTLTFQGVPVPLPEILGHEHRGNSPAPMADRP